MTQENVRLYGLAKESMGQAILRDTPRRTTQRKRERLQRIVSNPPCVKQGEARLRPLSAERVSTHSGSGEWLMPEVGFEGIRAHRSLTGRERIGEDILAG